MRNIVRGVQPVALSHVRATDGSKRATSDFQVQLKLVNSKSMGPEEILRVIRSSS